jgi:Family of unknown function (DUF6325)
MAMGPVDVVVIAFAGNNFRGEIAEALAEAVGNGSMHIIDLLFVKKDAAGNVVTIELDAIEPEIGDALDPYTDEVLGLIAEEDVAELAAEIEPNSAALLIVFEHLWAARLAEAVVAANGTLVSQLRVPREIVETVRAARSAGA